MARDLKPCGTTAAYNRHIRAGETPCADCKRAMAAYRAEQRGADRTPAAEQTVGDLVPEVFDDAAAAPKIEPESEYPRLYRVLNVSLPKAMPREVASIISVMLKILDKIETGADGGGEGGKSLAEQLEEAQAAREQREAAAREAR